MMTCVDNLTREEVANRAVLLHHEIMLKLIDDGVTRVPQTSLFIFKYHIPRGTLNPKIKHIMSPKGWIGIGASCAYLVPVKDSSFNI